MLKVDIQTGQDFSFTCDSAVLSKVVSKAVAVTNFSTSNEDEKKHFLVASKKRLFVIGFSSDTFIVLQVPEVKSSGDGSLVFSPKVLLGLTKNRKELNYEFKNNKLTFNAVKGKYSASIDTETVPSDQIPHLSRLMKVKSESGGSISNEVLEEIRKGIKYTDIKDYYNDEQILSAIRIKDSVLDISSHDNYHMSYYRSEINSESDFQLSIPVTTFKLIDKFISDEGESADFHLDNKQFKIVGKTYTISLPPVQVDDDYYDRVPGYIKSLKEPVAELRFDSNAITTVDNMFTLADDETRLSMAISTKGRVDISMAAPGGKIADAFKSKKFKLDSKDKIEFMVDPRIFSDLFGKVRDRKEIPMRLYAKRNSGVSSCFMISASTKTTKAYMVGTYYEE